MKLNIYTTGSQIIERVGECGSKIHLVSKTDPSSIFLSDSNGQVNFNYFDQLSPYIQVLTNNTSNNNTLFNKKSYSNNNTNTSSSMTLSYMIRSIKWSCNGVAIINDNELSVTCNAVIRKTDDLVGQNIVADISIVNASPIINNIKNNNPSNVSAMPEARMTMSQTYAYEEESETVSTDDYKSINIGELTIGDYMSYSIVNFNTSTNKCYVHTTGQNVTLFGYEFVSNELVPSCTLRFYNNNDNRYIGSAFIKELQRGDHTVALIGESTLATCKSFVERFDVANGNNISNDSNNVGVLVEHPVFITINERVTLNFNNKSNSVVVMKVKHYVEDADIVSISQEYIKRENGYVTWQFDISSGEHVVSIDLVLRKYNTNVH